MGSVRGAFTKASGDSQCVEEIKEVEGGPGFKIMSPARLWKAKEGPGGGVGVEVAYIESRGKRVEF